MPSPKISTSRKGGNEKNKKGRLSERASSFSGRGDKIVSEMLPRPRTVPDLLAGRREDTVSSSNQGFRVAKLTKLLLKVTIQRSPGPVQVVMSPEATVKELIAAALRQYQKEARRPVLNSGDADGFDLHYSQFSLESLDIEEKLISLGSRNFFLCPKKHFMTTQTCGGTSTSTCSKEAATDNCGTRRTLPWTKFMDFFTMNHSQLHANKTICGTN